MIRYVILLIVAVTLNSCCIFRKVRIKTETITEIKVDTIIRVMRDTITLTDHVTLFDTAYIETDVAKAKSYYDPGMKKIVLQLQGKPFDVRVTFDKKQIISSDIRTKEPVKKIPWFIWLSLGIVSGIILTMIIYERFKRKVLY